MPNIDSLIHAVDQPPLPDPGTKHRGVLTFSHPMLRGWEWPFVVARGREDGPSIALLSGVHAGEYPPMVANIRFMRDLEPAQLRGSIVSFPVIDPPALYARSAFVCPIDGKNPNRCFPGSPTGTFSDVLAHAVFTNVIQRATHLIDLHCGDVFEHLAPYAGCRGSGRAEIDDVALGMAKAFGLPTVVAYPPGDVALPSTTTAAAAAAGIPAIVSEAGGRGLLTEPETNMQLRGIHNVLRYLGTLDGQPEIPADQRVFGSSSALHTPVEGLWYPEVDLTAKVATGQRIGRVENLFGDLLAEIHAPVSGTILYLTSSPAVRKDGLLGAIGAA